MIKSEYWLMFYRMLCVLVGFLGVGVARYYHDQMIRTWAATGLVVVCVVLYNYFTDKYCAIRSEEHKD